MMKGREHIALVVRAYAFVAVLVAMFFMATRSGRITEATALIIAALVAFPILLPLVWERLEKLKLGPLEIELSAASATVNASLTSELRDAERLEMGVSAIPDLIEKLSFAIEQAGRAGVAEVDIGVGRSWWTTRLYLLAALADEYTAIESIVLVEAREGLARSFVGSATPKALRDALALRMPQLAESLRAARGVPAPDPDSTASEAVAWIAQRFVQEFGGFGGEREAKEWVTRELLSEFGGALRQGVQWDGGKAPVWLLHQILSCQDRFVPLVRNRGELGLVVDRLKLGESVALTILRNKLG